MSTTQPQPYPTDEQWMYLTARRSTVQAARYLARWLHVRSPAGVGTWTPEQLRAHYTLLIEAKAGAAGWLHSQYALPWLPSYPPRSVRLKFGWRGDSSQFPPQ